MPQGLFQRITGVEGQIRIRSLNAVIGTFTEWTLSRRRAKDGDGYDEEGLYDFRATLAYVNRVLWDDPEFEERREVKIVIDRKSRKQYRVVCDPGFGARINGSTLLMEGTRLQDG